MKNPVNNGLNGPIERLPKASTVVSQRLARIIFN
jgi:hypothetical protein